MRGRRITVRPLTRWPELAYGCGTEMRDARINSANRSSASNIDRPSSCRLVSEAALFLVEGRPSRGLGVTDVDRA